MNINSVNLSEVTTYRFGGICKNFISIESEDDLSDLENILKGKQNAVSYTHLTLPTKQAV